MRQLEGWRSVRTWGLGITVVLAGVVGAASSSCAFETKTNFCAAFGLRCREGQECAAKQAICIDIGGCGNGVLDTGEVCDDGNVVDRAWDDEFLDGFLATEKWGNDNVSFPGECYRRYIQELYQDNRLVQGTMRLAGRPARLDAIDCPLLARAEEVAVPPIARSAVVLKGARTPAFNCQ